jgi:hypothetical protein
VLGVGCWMVCSLVSLLVREQGSELVSLLVGWLEERRRVISDEENVASTTGSVDLSSVAYELNYDCVAFHSVDYSPVSYTQLECSLQSTR